MLAGTQLLASVCGFLRDQAFSITFPLTEGSVGVASAYIAAFRPSDLLFQLFVMSSLSVILVPFLASHLAHGRTEEMNRITSSILLLLGIVFGAIALVMIAVFPLLAAHFVHFQGDTLVLYIRFARIAFLTNFLFVFGNTIGQYLITRQRYWVYGLSPIVWSLSTIAGIYLLSPVIGPMGPIVGTLIGTVLYVIIRAMGVWQAGFRFTLPANGWVHRELAEMGWLILPRMAALGALQLQLLLHDKFASSLGNQMVALNQFASNFESVIPGIVGIAIAQAAFSLLSQSVARHEYGRFRQLIRKSIAFNLSIALPGSVLLALAWPVAVWLLRLQPTAAGMFASSLLLYCLAIPFESTNHILLRSFYALKNTTWPAVSSSCSALSAILSAALLLPSLGLYALAVGYVLGQVTQTLLLGFALRPRLTRASLPDFR